MLSLAGKRAIVTGAGSGIGKEIALLFAQQGAVLGILEIDQKTGNETVNEIREAGGEAELLCGDASDQKTVIGLFDTFCGEAGRLDVLVNNAAVASIGKLEDTSEAEMDRIYSINIKGVYNCLYAGIPWMKAKGGAILNMASIAAMLGLADRFAYSMSKGAVLMMTYSIAKDYIKEGIRCNAISPARVHTPFVDGFIAKNYPGKEAEMFQKLSATQPIGRMGKPSEIAALALFLCSDEAGFITGSNYPIDGGFVHLNS